MILLSSVVPKQQPKQGQICFLQSDTRSFWKVTLIYSIIPTPRSLHASFVVAPLPRLKEVGCKKDTVATSCQQGFCCPPFCVGECVRANVLMCTCDCEHEPVGHVYALSISSSHQEGSPDKTAPLISPRMRQPDSI